jgi:hypothetical protein
MRLFFVIGFLAVMMNSFGMSLSEAFHNNGVEVVIKGVDSDLFADKSIQIDVVNNTGKAITIEETPGYIFNSEDADVQDMILTEPLMFVVQPKSKSSTGLYAMCIQLSNKSPRPDYKYLPGEYAKGNLLLASQFVHQNQFQNSMGQDAIWSISDDKSVYDITGPAEITNALRKFIAELKGVTFDTTLINKNEIYVPSTIKEYALFLKFYLQQSDHIKLQLFDHKGDFVRDLINKPNQMKGRYDMQYKIALKGLIGEKYYVRLFVGDEMRTEFPLLIQAS